MVKQFQGEIPVIDKYENDMKCMWPYGRTCLRAPFAKVTDICLIWYKPNTVLFSRLLGYIKSICRPMVKQFQGEIPLIDKYENDMKCICGHMVEHVLTLFCSLDHSDTWNICRPMVKHFQGVLPFPTVSILAKLFLPFHFLPPTPTRPSSPVCATANQFCQILSNNGAEPQNVQAKSALDMWVW